MMPYLTIFRSRTLALLQYRLAAAAKLSPPLFVGLVQVMFYTAFYAGTSAEQPLSLSQTITYVWIVQMLVLVQPWNGDPEVLQIIRTGNLAYELCRPLDLYTHWFSRMAAQRLVPMLLTGLPLAAVALFLLPEAYRMGPPASAASLLAFLLSLAGAVLLSSALSNILGIITLWTISGEGLYYLIPLLVMIFSGAIVPLPLFPPEWQGLLQALPFRGLLDTPALLYLGVIPPGRALLLIGPQLLWIGLFVLIGRLLLGRALRAAVIQGG